MMNRRNFLGLAVGAAAFAGLAGSGKKKGGFADADLSALSEEELARQAELLELE